MHNVSTVEYGKSRASQPWGCCVVWARWTIRVRIRAWGAQHVRRSVHVSIYTVAGAKRRGQAESGKKSTEVEIEVESGRSFT